MRDLVKKNSFIRGVVITTLISFFSFSIIPSQALAQGVLLGLPQPGVMVSFSPSFTPALLRGVEVHPDDPLRFDFIIDSGDSGLEGQALEQEARKLITYFLASLTIPEDDFWVNLSPYEQDRIIADALSQTEMGRDLLAQDYILKQLTSSLMHPDHELGKVFWDRVYEKAYQQYGTTQIPVDTFNKVWIVPSQAVVYEHGHYAFVGERHLSVMLEEDYIALEHNQDRRDLGPTHFESQEIREVATLSSGVVRDVLLPEIEKEVNQGELFAPLRQIFDAAILAAWYKTALRESILNQIYSDQNKVLGIDMEDKTVKERIYNQYLEAFEKGVCDLIRVEKDIATGQYIPRKYFTGGMQMAPEIERKRLTPGNAGVVYPTRKGSQKKVSVNLSPTISFDLITLVSHKREEIIYDTPGGQVIITTYEERSRGQDYETGVIADQVHDGDDNSPFTFPGSYVAKEIIAKATQARLDFVERIIEERVEIDDEVQWQPLIDALIKAISFERQVYTRHQDNRQSTAVRYFVDQNMVDQAFNLYVSRGAMITRERPSAPIENRLTDQAMRVSSENVFTPFIEHQERELNLLVQDVDNFFEAFFEHELVNPELGYYNYYDYDYLTEFQNKHEINKELGFYVSADPVARVVLGTLILEISDKVEEIIQQISNEKEGAMESLGPLGSQIKELQKHFPSIENMYAISGQGQTLIVKEVQELITRKDEKEYVAIRIFYEQDDKPSDNLEFLFEIIDAFYDKKIEAIGDMIKQMSLSGESKTLLNQNIEKLARALTNAISYESYTSQGPEGKYQEFLVIVNELEAQSIITGYLDHLSRLVSPHEIVSTSDHAMETDATDPSALGGIDLGTAVSALEIRRDAGGMPLPLSQQPLELQNIEGFVPLIINIMPFNPQLILGEIEAQDAQDFFQISMAK